MAEKRSYESSGPSLKTIYVNGQTVKGLTDEEIIARVAGRNALAGVQRIVLWMMDGKDRVIYEKDLSLKGRRE